MTIVQKIFTTIFFTLASMPVLADTLEDKLQQDIDALTRAYDEHIQKLQNARTSAPTTTQTNSTQKTKTPKANPRTKESNNNNNSQEPKVAKVGEDCTDRIENAETAKWKKTGQGTSLDCFATKCKNGYDFGPEKKSCVKKQSDNKNYTIPENEIPKITGLGTCQELAEQAVYCYITTNDPDCHDSAKLTTIFPLEDIARMEYLKYGSQLNSFQKQWENRDKILPTVIEFCEDSLKRSKSDNESNVVNADKDHAVQSTSTTTQKNDSVSTQTKTKKNKKKTFNYLDPDTIETTNYRVAYGEVYLLNSKDVKILPNLGNHDSSMECPEISEGEWCALYNTTPQETIIIGNYQCNNSTISSNDNDIVGPHCWCGSTEPMGYWVYFGSYRDANDCDKNCAIEQCIKVAADTKDGLRKMLINYNSGTTDEAVSTTLLSYKNQESSPTPECEAAIDEEFSNGVPEEYQEVYNKRLKTMENIEISVPSDHIHRLYHSSDASKDKIICRENNHFLKECENSSTVLPLVSSYQIRQQVKQRDCDPTIKVKTDFIVEEENIHKAVY